MKHVLEKEYETFCETTKETTAKKFHELILNSIVKRLQLVCGLTARMKMSMKGDEVIVAVHADLEDLVTTCASYKHAHRICLHPGGHYCHHCYCAANPTYHLLLCYHYLPPATVLSLLTKMTEAERSKTRLQMHNFPFLENTEYKKQ